MGMRSRTINLLLIFGLQPLWTVQDVMEKPPDLPAYLEVTSRIGTGGQPTAAGLHALAEKDYQVVINLRTAGEAGELAEEEGIVTALGLRYYSLPVPGKAPQEQQAREFLKLMDGMKQDRVFIHCATANRVGSLMLVYRVLRDGIAQNEAEEEARRIGLRSEVLLDFARSFISHAAK